MRRTSERTFVTLLYGVIICLFVACGETSDESFFENADFRCKDCYCEETTNSEFGYNQCMTVANPTCAEVEDEASGCERECQCGAL